MALNSHQILARAAYEDGDLSHNGDQIRDVGDTLYTAIMVELSDDEGCDSREAALSRARRMALGIAQVITALEDDEA